MAKKLARRKRRSGTKAQAIRDELAKQGARARPKDVIAALAARGIEVSSAQVSNLKNSSGKGKRKKRRMGRRATTNGSLSLELLVAAKSLAEKLGGVDEARRALDALAKLL